MPKGLKTGMDTSEKRRDWARKRRAEAIAREKRAQANVGIGTSTFTKVRDPEVALTIVSVFDESTGKHWFKLMHKSNHPNDQLMMEQSENFDELMELIQEVLEKDLDEEL